MLRRNPHRITSPQPCSIRAWYLVNHLGISPSHINIEGDLAGANLALALVRYPIEYRSEGDNSARRLSKLLLLLSPCTDLPRASPMERPNRRCLSPCHRMGSARPVSPNWPSWVSSKRCCGHKSLYLPGFVALQRGSICKFPEDVHQRGWC